MERARVINTTQGELLCKGKLCYRAKKKKELKTTSQRAEVNASFLLYS